MTPRRTSHRALFGLLAILALAGCSHSEHSAPGSTEGTSDEHAEGSKTSPAGTVVVTLEMQRALHLEVDTLRAVATPRQISAFGRVLDPQPLAASLSEWGTARAAAAASNEELQRVRTLAKQNTASARTVQAAEAAAVRDRLLAQSIRDRIELSWGRALAHRADLDALLAALIAQDRLIVRIDLPGGEGASLEPRGARLTSLAESGKSAHAEYLGPAPTTDPELQGRGFLFLTPDNPLKLAPGAAVSASLELAGEPLHGISLPDSAVLRYQTQTWVYLQRTPTSFVRTRVELGPALPEGWLVTDGLRASDRVVVQGAQVLLSEELKPETRLED